MAADGVPAQGYMARAKAEWGKGYEPYPQPDGKAGMMKFGPMGAVSEDAAETPYINTLKNDLANSYYWSGNIGLDYLFFVCQWHPWLGVLGCHPNHPWTRVERILMLAIAISISVVPSAFIAEKSAGDSMVSAAAGKVSSILFITIPNIIFGVLLYQLSIADTRCPHCSWCCGKVQKCLFCISLVFGVVSTIIAYEIMETSTHKETWTELMKPLVYGQLVSQITWFPLWLLLPCQLGFLSLWCSEKKALEEEAGNAEKQALVAE